MRNFNSGKRLGSMVSQTESGFELMMSSGRNENDQEQDGVSSRYGDRSRSKDGSLSIGKAEQKKIRGTVSRVPRWVGFPLIFLGLGAAWYGYIWLTPPTLAFLFEVEAIVEGERVTLSTKQVCDSVREGEIFLPKRTRFRNPRFSIGYKLKSGRGIYAIVPNYCSRVDTALNPPFWRKKDIDGPHDRIPTLYFSNDYDNPVEFKYNLNPNGYDLDRDKIEVVRAIARPLIGGEVGSYTQRLGEGNVPWRKGDDYSHVGYAFFPINLPDAVKINTADAIGSAGRYALYRQYFRGLSYQLGYTPLHYYDPISFGVSRDAQLKRFDLIERENRKRQPKIHYSVNGRSPRETILKDFPRIIPIRILNGGALKIEEPMRAIVYIYRTSKPPFNKMLRNNKYFKFIINSRKVSFEPSGKRPTDMILYDRKERQYYVVIQINFSMQGTERK